MRSTADSPVGTLQGSSIRDDSSHSIQPQIEYELRHAIDFMWLSSGREIDHTTLSEFRRKHADQLRDIFNQVIRRAIDLGVAKLSSLCIDGTRVLADANRYKTWTTDRLAQPLKLLDDQIAEALESLEVTDTLEADMWGRGVL
ncbi:MAG: transposase [Pirellulales bacterium]